MPGERLALHEVAQFALCGLHHQFEVVLLLDAKGKSRQGDERVAGTAFKPWVTGEELAFVVGQTLVELVCGIDETVEEIVAWVALVHLTLEEFLQC